MNRRVTHLTRTTSDTQNQLTDHKIRLEVVPNSTPEARTIGLAQRPSSQISFELINTRNRKPLRCLGQKHPKSDRLSLPIATLHPDDINLHVSRQVKSISSFSKCNQR